MSIVVNIGLPLLIILAMTVVGLELTVADLRRVMHYPLHVAAALLGQTLILPLIAAALILTLRPEPVIAGGLILAAAAGDFFQLLLPACPCGCCLVGHINRSVERTGSRDDANRRRPGVQLAAKPGHSVCTPRTEGRAASADGSAAAGERGHASATLCTGICRAQSHKVSVVERCHNRTDVDDTSRRSIRQHMANACAGSTNRTPVHGWRRGTRVCNCQVVLLEPGRHRDYGRRVSVTQPQHRHTGRSQRPRTARLPVFRSRVLRRAVTAAHSGDDAFATSK